MSERELVSDIYIYIYIYIVRSIETEAKYICKRRIKRKEKFSTLWLIEKCWRGGKREAGRVGGSKATYG